MDVDPPAVATPPAVTSRSAAASAWADVAGADVEQLIALARIKGWDAALDAFAARSPFFVARLRNLALGNWHALLLQPRDTRALDVGCGFGALVAGLAASYSRAVGVEMLPERLRFTALREPRHAISLVRGSGHALPFAARSFGLVTMNGVLEWAGHYLAGEPRALQLGMLREARRLLSPSGVLAVAIENRFALETLLGMRDTHTGLHLVPALPRTLAEAWSRVRGKGAYRAYLYSLAGYRALFREAGFLEARVLDLTPSYNDYDFVVEPRDGATYELLWRRGWVRSFARGTAPVRARLSAARPAWLGGLAYAYLVLGGVGQSALDADHGLWRALDGLGIGPGEARFAISLTEPGAMAIATHTGGELLGVTFLCRRPPADGPLGTIRSRTLARDLTGRLVPAGELDYQDYRVLAYGVGAGSGSHRNG